MGEWENGKVDSHFIAAMASKIVCEIVNLGNCINIQSEMNILSQSGLLADKRRVLLLLVQRKTIRSNNSTFRPNSNTKDNYSTNNALLPQTVQKQLHTHTRQQAMLS